MSQRLQWVREAVEGVWLLHSANVIQCDADLAFKIADFLILNIIASLQFNYLFSEYRQSVIDVLYRTLYRILATFKLLDDWK